MIDYTHFNLNDVDPTFQNVDTGMKSLRLAKLEFKILTIQNGKKAQAEGPYEAPIVNGRFIVFNDEAFSGRRIQYTFWLDNAVDQKGLKRLMDAIGVQQEAGESLEDLCKRVSTLEPAPEFKVFVTEKPGRGLKDDGTPQMENTIKWNQVSPL